MTEQYELLEPEKVAAYIDAHPDLAARVDTSTLDVTEVGDGNLNLVFVCQDGSGRGLVLKQALPYVRLVGPSWPFTPKRAVAEARAYEVHGRFAAEYLPAFYGFDAARYILAMEDLTDHRVWRGALTDGERHDGAAADIGRYVARVAFHTGVFGVEAKALKALVAGAISPELCEITEDLVLTEPFSGAERNWYQDELEDAARSLQTPELKAAAGELKYAFMTRAEALLHGDLHTGSVMVREGSTRAFDSEFAFYGPIAFDLALPWSNFVVTMARDAVLGRDEHGAWAATLFEELWDAFEAEFRSLWPNVVDPRVYNELFLERWLAQTQRDTAAFAATEAARRIVGLAHAPDLEALDPEPRAVAGRAVIETVKRLLLDRPETAAEVSAVAREEVARG
ncbi:5'-methylthioribose kinase [Solirubrobacter pauli]|uniref:S-methyl-5-thioribose kinase n=1 Tax=Solirubrobacter pauli TaxID=166793 RepID=A0A660LF20_9ACTN|nr:S-methyl-5-thioribose kinase [Solirubrobacter pauli]RKQ91514.1 5'-methylthioribose kinase [Solirubrobacter pauli]